MTRSEARARLQGSHVPCEVGGRLWSSIYRRAGVRLTEIQLGPPWKTDERESPFELRGSIDQTTAWGLARRFDAKGEARSLGAIELDPEVIVRWQRAEDGVSEAPGRWDYDAVTDGGSMYIGKGHCFCRLDATNGRLAWKAHLGSVEDGARKPVLAASGIIVGTATGFAFVDRVAGNVSWTVNQRGSRTVVDDAVVGVSSESGGQVDVWRLGDGKKVSTLSLSRVSRGAKRSTTNSVILAPPSVVKGRVVFGDELGYIWVFDPKDGTAESYRPPGCMGFLGGRPVPTENGFLIVSGSVDAKSLPVLYSFDAKW